MELRKGYKQTDIGEIPKDWEVKKLSEITSLMTNGFVGTATSFYSESDSDILYIQGYNVEENGFNFRGIKYVTKDFHRQHSKSSLQEGDLLTIQTGDVGLTAIVPRELVGSNCHALIISRFKKENFDSKYYHYYFNSFNGRSRLKSIETGTTMKHINVGDLLQFEVPVAPTKEEQTAIANSLRDADALISSIERLVEKKRNIKQGAMQQLLKPKKEWYKKCIKEIVLTPVTDGPHETPIFYTMGIPFLSVNNLVDKKIDFTDLRNISLEDHLKYSRKCKPQRNDILLGKAASVGKVAIVETDLEFNIWSPIAMIRVKPDYSSKYIYYYLQTEDIVKQIEFFTNSSSQGNIGMGDIEKIEIPLPKTLNEQMEIATILSDMDNEIHSLESKLSKAKMLKQGMMQELLTGKIRLI